MDELKLLKDRIRDYKVENFMNLLCNAYSIIGSYNTRTACSRSETLLIPLLQNREVISSMCIEGTQTTLNEVLEVTISNEESHDDKVKREIKNHMDALVYGADYLTKNKKFSKEFIEKLHGILMKGIVSKELEKGIGKYKTKDNKIVNSLNKVVFNPPSYKDTNKYMDDLIYYMNNNEIKENELVRAAIIHSQFESIHPFDDGNGRVGRLLIGLYLFNCGVIKTPIFYISEAINQEKSVYYAMLTDSRINNYDEWIKFFLRKCIIQADIHYKYITSFDRLHDEVDKSLKNKFNSSKTERIVEALFKQPLLTSNFLSEYVGISQSQANKYLLAMESMGIIQGDDKKRYRKYSFGALIDLVVRGQ